MASLELTVVARSPRTLQRRLAREGTSFQEVLDGFRRIMAADLLDHPNLAIKEIAFLLGYSDLSAFYRAFRRWHGQAPDAYRTSAPRKPSTSPVGRSRRIGRLR